MFSILKTILKSTFKKPSTIKYPLEKKENDPLVRGHIEIEIDKCIYCGMCQRKCPTGAIEVIRPEETWIISRFNCIQCGSCVEACPKKCLHMNNGLTSASTEKIRDVVKKCTSTP